MDLPPALARAHAGASRRPGRRGDRRLTVVVGIDQGTTGTRTVAFDERFSVLAQAYRRVPVEHPRPGWVEKDAEAVITSVSETLAEVAAAVGSDRITAVGLDNEGESVVAWDAETLRPLAPAIVWSCRRSEGIVEELAAAGAGDRVHDLAGTRLDPYFSSTKITWLLRESEAVRDAAAAGRARFGTFDAYVCARLGDGPRTEPSTAARTQLQELARPGSWSRELCDVFGVDPATLPEIGPSVGDAGSLRVEGVERPLPLRALLVDQTAALAGHGAVAAGTAKATYGTGIFLLAHAGEEPPTDASGLLPTVAWQVAGRSDYALDGGVFSAGSAVDWLVSLGLAGAPQDTGDLAASVPDSGGVRFLPALTGLGAPWWRPDARATWAGMTAHTTPAHLVRAALESLCFRVRDIVEALRAAGLAPAALGVDGGMTANPWLMQRQADVLGIPVRIAATAEATALGTAAAAGVGAGCWTLADLASLGEGGRTVDPGPGSEPAREDEYAAWRAFVAEQQ
ncbi:MAG TPA: FGGY family carbohydrate kinase [Gaiellales bacterium]|nr:FGGY family carbohydrate kinase [Gaiellales bacterium]